MVLHGGRRDAGLLVSKGAHVRLALVVMALMGVAGCRRPPTTVSAWSESQLDEARERYFSSLEFRRKSLVDSLENPTNIYSRQRLAAYAVESGWEGLPEWNPRSERLAADLKPIADEAPPLWNGRTPQTRAAWEALGKEVFFAYPLRSEVLADFAVANPEEAEASGVERDAEGRYVGLVSFKDVDGQTRVGITCALCHVAIEGEAMVPGAARRRFDYGRLKLAYHRETKVPLDEELARRMASWGPGRADVTEDFDEDPVAIPDLFGLAEQTALTHAGTIRHVSPIALAIRQETQLLHSNHERVRPPRELVWALTMYLYSLKPPEKAATAGVERGAQLFSQSCQQCHSNRAYGGPPLDARRIGTDLKLADGTARGTGKYRPPALLRVGAAAPFLHHGAVPTLEDLFSSERLSAEYTRSPLGPGPVPGHAYGTDWSQADRTALIAWLRTL